MDRRKIRGVRSGSIPIEAKLDLHGKNRTEAFQLLRGFILSSASSGKKMVCVITGRGKRTWEWNKSEGVLHKSFRDWLRHKEIAPYVIGPPSQAGPAHGGGGAWYVQLRSVPKRT